MSKVKISIVIATYNASKTLRRALDSVLSQKFQDWECIVIDGASRDETVSIVEEFEKKDARIRHISEPDNGIYDAFNKGWRLACGVWVYYLGSDDFLTQDSFSNIALLDTLVDEGTYLSGNVVYHSTIGRERILKGSHQGVLMKRKMLEKLGGFDEQYRILADKDLLLRANLLGFKKITIDSTLAHFSSGGASSNIKNIVALNMERYSIDKKNPNLKFPILRSVKYFFVTILASLYVKIKTSLFK